jgi:hypothetical protein
MKSTNDFKNVIKAHLEMRAINDPLFAETLLKPNKNIDDCISYILETVKKSGCSGFDDDEVFGMAVHYYDEDDIKTNGAVKGSVVINYQVMLTAEEIKEAKEKAFEQVVQEEKKRLTTKKVTPVKITEEKTDTELKLL